MKSKVLVHPGMAAWRFLVLPIIDGREIKEKYGKNARGFGSLPVLVKVGKTEWKTSIFPEKQSGSYVLPLKIKIRQIEEIDDDSNVTFTIKLKF